MQKEDWQKRGTGHRERLRQRFLNGGLEQFTDEEVVEFLLTLGTPRGDLKKRRQGCHAGIRHAIRCSVGAQKEAYGDSGHRREKRPLPGSGSSDSQTISSRSHCGKDLFWIIPSGFRLSFSFHAGPQREVFRVFFLTRKNQVITDCDLF